MVLRVCSDGIDGTEGQEHLEICGVVKARIPSTPSVAGSNPAGGASRRSSIGRAMANIRAADSRHSIPGWRRAELLRLSHDAASQVASWLDFPPGRSFDKSFPARAHRSVVRAGAAGGEQPPAQRSWTP